MRVSFVAVLALAIGVAAAGAAGGVRELGRSVEGRPIKIVRAGCAEAATRVLVVGQIHGDEPAGLRVVRALRKLEPPEGVAVWSVTSVNPDGAARGIRQNAHRVDLNRNFPYRWREGPRGNRYYGGPRPLSEPESRVVRDLVRQLRPRLTIWFHQPYGFVNFSQGADRRLVREYARLVDMPARALPHYPGTATQWQNHTQPAGDAFIVELRAAQLPYRRARRHARAILKLAAGLEPGGPG